VLHKVHIYLEYRSVCPLVGIGTLRPPLPQASVYRVLPPPLILRRGGHTRLVVREWGVLIRTTGEKAQHSVYFVGCN
jgi:hypothetical protein